jgi:hypothetical protein
MANEKAADAVPMVPLSVVEALIAKIEQIGQQQGGLTADGLKTVLQAVSADNAKAIEKIVIPENKVSPLISAFSYPEGDTARPKPRLVDQLGIDRETIFCGARQREDQLTPEEILAFNNITEDCTARGGTWFARVKREGRKEFLWVHVPCVDVDERMELPSLLQILLELKEGAAAVDINVLVRQLNELKAQVEKVQVVSAR